MTPGVRGGFVSKSEVHLIARVIYMLGETQQEDLNYVKNELFKFQMRIFFVLLDCPSYVLPIEAFPCLHRLRNARVASSAH